MSDPITDLHVTSITKIMNFITWRRLMYILIVVVFLASAVILCQFTTFYLGRNDHTLPGIRMLTVTPAIYEKIADFNKKRSDVLAVQVTTLNFERNIRVETISHIDNKLVQELYTTFVSNLVYHPPIFDTDSVNNSRTLKLANGEFICNPYKESVAYKYAPSGSSVISVVCAVAIPPYNHDISGIMTFYLSEEPTEEQKSSLFIFARDTSIQIHNDSKNAHKKLVRLE